MAKLPACSSKEAISALKRLGFEKPRKSKGSHQTMVRERPGKPKDIAVIKLAESEIPKGTLTKILRLANVTVEEFVRAL